MLHKLFTLFRKCLHWVIYSSKDPRKWSLTIKGTGVYVVQFVIPSLALFGYTITGDDATSMINTIADVVEQGLQWIGTVMIAYGAVRKFWLTMFKPR